MEDQLTSIMAIQKCMRSLKLPLNEGSTQQAEAEVRNLDGEYMSGSIVVTFHCNHHSGLGPHIEMGNEIRGYGINFNEFKPQFQNFEFNELGKILTVKGKGYMFSLKFDLDA